MTLQNLGGRLLYPNWWPIGAAPARLTWFTLDAATEYFAMIFQAKEDMTISHVAYIPNTVAGSPTASIRIETVDTNGAPTGTLWAANTSGTTGTLVANTVDLTALTASASITKGQVVAIVVLYASGTSMTSQYESSCPSTTGWLDQPYMYGNQAGAQKYHLLPTAMAVGNSATTFYSIPGFFPFTAVTNSLFNNTNSAARGLRFQVPFKARMCGLSFYNTNAAGDFNAVLYDDAGTELGSSSTAIDALQGGGFTDGLLECLFDNSVTLEPATWYRAAVEPSSVTNIGFSTYTLPSADYRSALQIGTNSAYASRSSGVWTDTTTQTPLMSILLDQLDDGAGGSGGGLRLAGHGGLAA